jgi:hypothetical protein
LEHHPSSFYRRALAIPGRWGGDLLRVPTLGLDHFYVCNAATNDASHRVKQKTGAEFVGFIELAHHGEQSKSEKWIVRREAWLRARRAQSQT